LRNTSHSDLILPCEHTGSCMMYSYSAQKKCDEGRTPQLWSRKLTPLNTLKSATLLQASYLNKDFWKVM